MSEDSSFFLYTSNRTEQLLGRLAQVIQARKQARQNIFEKEIFLIQSQGMERMISQAMSDYFGSWCNYSYFSPIKLLDFITEQLGIEQNSAGFDRGHLIWQLDKLLWEMTDDTLAPVKNYIRGENGSLKRFQLARQLANIFDQYQLMREDMLAGWSVGEPLAGSEAELWQMALWNRLQEDLAPDKHRGVVLKEIISFLKQGTVPVDLPSDLYIFGLHIMPPLFLECMQALSLHVKVHLFLFSPCRQYWGDVDTKRNAVRRAITSSDPEQQLILAETEHHPLLRSYGQQGRVFQEMLLEAIDFCGEDDVYVEPDGDTLLHQLQRDLLDNIVEPEDVLERRTMDSSLEIISCHSRFREIMILRDHVLKKLNQESELELREIVVMAPDIQEYVPFIEAVFHDIHHSIADRSSRRRNAVFAAFSSFLHLFSGRFGWSEVLEILQLPVIYPQFDLAGPDLENLKRWVVDAGIRWGLSGLQRSDDLALDDFSENSWQQGLERLLLGYAMSGDYEFHGIFPFEDIEGGSGAALGGLLEFIEHVKQVREKLRHPKLVWEWVEVFLESCEKLFGQQDSRDLLELRSILTELKEKGTLSSTYPVDFPVMLDWFDHAARESRTSSGFLRGQITFCSMLPMRSIPFKVVCLIGLNDGDFPKRDQFATFDLMGEAGKRRKGDRSARDDDRYQFLEAILAARETLYLSYVGQSIKNNDPIPPSVVVTELIETLEQYYGIDNPVTSHPLQPFSGRYFDGVDPRLYSYDRDYCRLAQTLQDDFEAKGPWWQGQIKYDEDSIRFGQLLSFFAEPGSWFVRNRLGIDVRLEDGSPEETELFTIDHLTRYQVNQTLITGIQAGRKPHELLRSFRASGEWFPSVPGEIEAGKAVENIGVYLDRINELGVGEACEAVDFSLQVGDKTLYGRLDGLHQRGLVVIRFGECRGKDVLKTLLYFLVSQRALEKPFPVHLVTSKQVYTLRPEHTAELLSLDELLAYFFIGCERPLELLVNPAFAYVKQRLGSGKKPPGQVAKEKWNSDLENGYTPELELLYQGKTTEDILGQQFEELTLKIVEPVWRLFLGK